MRKLLVVILAAGIIAIGPGAGSLYAGEVDILLQKLVDKGVLTAGEAQEIKTETQEQVKKEISQGKYSSLPAWVQNTKLKGDLRIRYQYKHEKAANDYNKDTQVGRLRARVGLESKINEKLLAGIGIATSSGDPRSTNVTFGDTSSHGDGGYSSKFSIRLDYGYAKYSPLSWLNLVAGKMLLNDALWEPTDLIWDTDITPEGGVVQFNKALTANASAFLNGGVLIETADTSTTGDTIVGYMAQPGMNYKLNDAVSLKGAFTYYNFSNTKGNAYPTASWYKSSNTKQGSNWKYGYRMVSPSLEVKIVEPLKVLGIGLESFKVFGEYVNNLAVTQKATGFSTGFQFGNEKIEKWGDWQARYVYAMLEKDAVPDFLPDSDRYGGKTGMRSHEVALSYGLGKNTYLGVDVYRSWNIMGTPKAPETLVQADWNMKF